MIAWMRLTNWMTGAATLALVLLVFTGCSSSSGSRSAGCSGGCCRGEVTRPTPAAISPLASGAVTPLPAGNAVSSAEKPYGGQKTCPVTGEDLGSMGPPIPASVKGQTVYVCCRGCVAKLQRDPDAFLAKVMADRAGQ